MQKRTVRDLARQELKQRTDPLLLAQTYFDIEPNEGQTQFLIELQVENILGHLLQSCRGGGKTIIAAIAIVWAALKHQKFKALILSGSYEQARTFYNYVRLFISQCEPLRKKIDGDPLQTETRFNDGGFIKVLTASEKSTRSPHVDMLIIDEFVLVKPDLIDSAWATVRTSKHPKRIFLTTVSQTQAAISLERWYNYWDHKDQYKFRTYEWGVEQCDWISQADLELARIILDPMIFDTEYLGKRVERRGAVFKTSQVDFAVKSAREFKPYKDETIAGVDWGYDPSKTVCTIIEKQELDGKEYSYLVHVEAHLRQDVTWWCNYTLPLLLQKYNIKHFYCDSSHKFNNEQMRNLGLPITSVPFSRFKEQMIGELRREFEQQIIKIPHVFEDTIRQVKSYTYGPNGKPLKGNDDYVDSLMLACWGATGKGLDKFELFAYESKEREERFKRKKKDDWWRDLVD